MDPKRDTDLLSSLFENALYPVLVHDGVFILHANRRAVELFRYENRTEIMTVALLDLFDPVSWPLAQERLAKLRADPEIPIPEASYVFHRKDGTHFLATVGTRSLGWMGDILARVFVFRSVLNQIHDVKE